MAPSFVHVLSTAEALQLVDAVGDATGRRRIKAGFAPPIPPREAWWAQIDVPGPTRHALHTHEQISWYAPLKVDEAYRIESRVRQVEPSRLGEAFVIERSIFAGAEPQQRRIMSSQSNIVLRESCRRQCRRPPTPEQAPDRVRRLNPSPFPEKAPQTRESPQTPKIQITQDQAQRFANATGDTNPIHLDPAAAREAGLRGCILHGLCTLTLVLNRLVQDHLADDPSSLSEVQATFCRPVFLSDNLSIQATPLPEDHRALSAEVRNQRGHKVLNIEHLRFSSP
jgi:acyl dehydratase